MIKKRLSAVVNVLDGQVVQSFGYKTFLPIGHPNDVLINLDRWHVDEIILQSLSRSRNKLGPDFKLLDCISSLKLTTPLIYGGGIRNPHDADNVISLGADRIIVGDLLLSDPNQLPGIVNHIGKQAVIASLPFTTLNPFVPINYTTNQIPNISRLIDLIHDDLVSELLLIDYHSEGLNSPWSDFDERLHSLFPLPLILFGGLSNPKDISNLLQYEHVSSIAVGNILSYKEFAYQALKDHISSSSFRPSYFSNFL